MQGVAILHCLPHNHRTGITGVNDTSHIHRILVKGAEATTRPVAVLIGKHEIDRLACHDRIVGKDVNDKRQVAIGK